MTQIINNSNISNELTKLEGQVRAMKIAQAYYEWDTKHMALNPDDEEWLEKYRALKKECAQVKRMMRDFLKKEEWFCEKGASEFKMFTEFVTCVRCRYDLFLSEVA